MLVFYFRLERSYGKNYLLQRARRSEIFCDSPPDCRLHAAQSFDKVVTYFETREKGIHISVENFVPGNGRITVYEDGDKYYTGGFYSHPDNVLSSDLNSTVLIQLADSISYLQLFSLSPHIVYMDYDLEVLDVFQIQSFNSLEILKNTYQCESSYTFNFDEAFSQLVWYYKLRNGDIMFIIRHAQEKALSAHPMDRELVTKHHDYYRFYADFGTMEYAGTSENYIIPLDAGFLMIEDYVLNYYEPYGTTAN